MKYKDISMNIWPISSRELQTVYLWKLQRRCLYLGICFTTISDPEQIYRCHFAWIKWYQFTCFLFNGFLFSLWPYPLCECSDNRSRVFYLMSFCLLHNVIIKEDNIVKCKQAPQSFQARQTYFENSSNLYEYFLEKNF